MNNAITVGLPAPPPTAASQSSPTAATGTDETAPFAEVLEGVGPKGPPPKSKPDEPPETEPGSLDLASLVQLLLTGDAISGDQTAIESSSQPDRLAGAGTNETDDAGAPADGAMLVAVMPPPIVPVVETAVGGPQVAPPSDGAISALTADQAASVPVVGEVAAALVDETAVVDPSVDGEAPVPVPAPVVADAAVDGLPEATATDGEQQQTVLSLAQAAAGEADLVEVEPSAAEVDALGQPETTEVDAASIEVVPEDVAVDEAAPDLAPVEVRANVSTEPAPAKQVGTTADAIVAPPVQPEPVSSRSIDRAPVADPATAAANEAFTADLANTVRRASLLGDHEVRLLLNPPDLGHLDIRIVESPEGLQVVLKTATSEAHELIERQLPSLRAALESRDLRIERLQVQQSSDTSTDQQQFQRGLMQDGQGADGQQSGHNATPWSPVASLRSDGAGELAAVGGATGSMARTGTTAGDGRVDLLA